MISVPVLEKKISRFFLSEISNRERHLIAGFFSLLLFMILLLWGKIFQPDLDEHIAISSRMMKGETIGHPLFFLLLQVFSLFSNENGPMLFAAFLIFSAASYGKIIFSLQLCETIREKTVNRLMNIMVILCQLALGFPFLSEGFIKGNLSPNFFHNGTLSLSIPPSLYLLNKSILWLKNKETGRPFRMLIAGIIIVLSKPSFLFCWIPVMPCYVLYKEGAGRKLISFLQISIVLIFALFAQSLLLKSSSINFKIVFAPLGFFGSIQNHLAVFFAAFIFPASTLITNLNYWKKNDGLFFLLMMVQGLFLSFLFYDVINGFISPNMTWQSSIMNYLLLLFGSIALADLLEKRRFILALFPALILIAQVVHGLLYLKIAVMIRSFYF
jgi:hypothetical protein